MDKINLAEKFNQFSTHWDPRIVSELNGQYVKIAKVKGEFVWHSHQHEDELFMVIMGELEIHFRDKVVNLSPGEIIVVPKGVEHKPVAKKEVQIMMFEPKSTLNTGQTESEMKRDKLEWI